MVISTIDALSMEGESAAPVMGAMIGGMLGQFPPDVKMKNFTARAVSCYRAVAVNDREVPITVRYEVELTVMVRAVAP